MFEQKRTRKRMLTNYAVCPLKCDGVALGFDLHFFPENNFRFFELEHYKTRSRAVYHLGIRSPRQRRVS